MSTALVFVLASPGLGQRTFWYDEVSSVLTARSTLSEIAQSIPATQASMSVYHFILHFWLGIGETEGRVRLLSMVAGAAAVPPIYLVARRVGGVPAGALAALAYAASPFVIYYAREARGYTLAMFTSACLTWLLLRALENPTTRRWIAYGVVASVGLYVHFFIGFVVLAHLIAVAASRRLPPARHLLAAGVPMAIAGAPLVPIVLLHGNVLGWIGATTIDGIGSTVSTLAGGWPLLLLSIPLVTYAVIAHPGSLLVRIALASLLVPIAVVIGLSLLKPILLARYLAVVVPALAVLVGIGVSAVRPRAARLVGVVSIAAFVVVGLVPVYARGNVDWRSATYWMAAELQAGDRVVYEKPITGREVTYYFGRNGVSRPPQPIPLQQAEDEPSSRVWIVLSGLGHADREQIKRDLEREYFPLEVRYLGYGVEVGIYAPR
jgi:mannosyltransferase